MYGTHSRQEGDCAKRQPVTGKRITTVMMAEACEETVKCSVMMSLMQDYTLLCVYAVCIQQRYPAVHCRGKPEGTTRQPEPVDHAQGGMSVVADVHKTVR